MKCTGHCIHLTILSSHRSVVTVSTPSVNGSHKGRPTKNNQYKVFLPVWRPSKPFNIRHLNVVCPRFVEKRKSKWLVGYHDTPPRSQPKAHLLLKHSPECHWATSSHRLYFSDFSNLYHKTTKCWSPTTVYEPPAILKITTHARGYLIKSDRSSVAFYEVKTIVTHYSLISILAAVS